MIQGVFLMSSSQLDVESTIRSSGLNSVICGKNIFVVEVHTFARLVQSFYYIMKYFKHICVFFILIQIVVRYNEVFPSCILMM